MQESRVNKKTLILVALFLTPVLFVPQSFASGTTQVSTFAGGANSITVTSDGNNTSTALQLDLERNVTFQDASFVVEGPICCEYAWKRLDQQQYRRHHLDLFRCRIW